MKHDFRGHIAGLEDDPHASQSQYLDTYILKPPFFKRHVIHVLEDVIT